MKRLLVFILQLSLFGILFTGCSQLSPTNKKDSDVVVVGNVGGEDVTLTELKANYQPTSESDSMTYDNLKEFLPVYLNYRAKLQEAKQAGYYEQPEIQEEYMNYAQKAANSYWIENKIKQQLLDEFHSRANEELKASHIIIALDQRALPKDTLKAYNTLMEAREKFKQGASFDSLAMVYSTKRQGQSMGGEVGYISAGRTVKSFEDAAYALEEGEVSTPVRTRFGYHLIYLKDRRERNSDRKVSHIFFRTRGNQDSAAAMDKAMDTYQKLENGAPWDSLAQVMSEDNRSRKNGGAIGWVNYGRFAESFMDPIVKLDSAGAYTKPFESQYGIHIVRLDSIRTYKNEQQERDKELEELKQLPRFKNNKAKVRKRIRELGNEQAFTKAINEFVDVAPKANADSIRLKNLSLPDSVDNLVAYSLNDSSYTVGTYLDWLQEKYPNTKIKSYQKSWFDTFKNQVTDRQMVPITKRMHPDFAVKVQRYLDGLVVFKISEDSVWNYAQTDTSALRKIYQQNTDQYTYDTRYVYSRISAENDSLLNLAIEQYNNGVNVDSIKNALENVWAYTDTVSYVDEKPLNRLKEMETGSLSDQFSYKKRPSVLIYHEKIAPRQMTFEEAYNKLVATYQPQREDQWIEHLRNKYDVQSFPERIESKNQAS